MKARNFISKLIVAVLAAAAFGSVGLVAARPDDPARPKVVVRTLVQSGDDDSSASSSAQGENKVVIQAVEPAGQKKQTKVVTWLGVAVAESPEVLSAQLGLKAGEGLTVSMLAADSPAVQAGLQKNDVLVEMDGQMLVLPMQLRKLVQMHAEGDTVALTYFRGGKKQTAPVKLGKTTWDEAAEKEDSSSEHDLQNFMFQFNGLDGQLRDASESMARAGLDKVKMKADLASTLNETRKAIQDAVRHASTARNSLASVDVELANLAGDGVEVDKDATVVIHNKGSSSRTIVQTDETGSYIIEAGAKTHLTARNKHGKLLFEGDIDTAAEREKVPKEIWEKVQPMFDQITPKTGSEPKTKTKTGD